MSTEVWRYQVNKAHDAECHYGGAAAGCGHYEIWVEYEDLSGRELHTITRDTTLEHAEAICEAMNERANRRLQGTLL